jgi:hypothetical protein
MKTLVRLALLAFLVLFARSSAALPEYYFYFTPATQSVAAGDSGTFTITMNKPDDAGNDAIFTIHCSDKTRVAVATSVVVPKGQTVASGTFDALAPGGPVTITATQPAAMGGKIQTISVVVTGSLDSGVTDAGEEPEAEEEKAAPTGGSGKPAPSSPTESESAAAPSSGGCSAAHARSGWALLFFAGVASVVFALRRSRRRR